MRLPALLSAEEVRVKVRSRQAVRRAVRAGLLVDPRKCAHCGALGMVEAHHEDPKRLIDGQKAEIVRVVWLCKGCYEPTRQAQLRDYRRRRRERLMAALPPGKPFDYLTVFPLTWQAIEERRIYRPPAEAKKSAREIKRLVRERVGRAPRPKLVTREERNMRARARLEVRKRVKSPDRCGECGTAGQVMAYIADYTRPVESVRWLCRPCMEPLIQARLKALRSSERTAPASATASAASPVAPAPYCAWCRKEPGGHFQWCVYAPDSTNMRHIRPT